MKKFIAAISAVVISTLFATSVFASPATVKSGVNIRTAPSVSSNVIRLLHTGTTVDVISQPNKYWAKVNVNGQIGYVSTNYLNFAAAPAPVNTSTKSQQIVNYAESFQNRVTYVFGSNNVSKLRLDCSSFTKMVYSHFGINLIWSSKSQAKQGSFVSKANLKPGDLVFFSVSQKGVVAHVGIYIGNGKFINNLPHQGVVISNLNSSYWTSHYITARRVI